MKIPFWKMHGAANDFILVDDREGTFPADSQGWIEEIASRRTGVGSDGLLLIQSSSNADFSMRFFNPDGREAEMCGNGARCIARLAHDIGIAGPDMTIETAAGLLRAEAEGDLVRLHMTPPQDWRMKQSLDLDGEPLAYHFVNSGVPHVVVEVEDVATIDVQAKGSTIRHHDAFAPAGANVNFITVTGPDALTVRTYERGVEAETLACGTGVVACGLVIGRLGNVQAPVHITCASGDVLDVNYRLTDESAEEVTLTGPAVYVFRGTLDYG